MKNALDSAVAEAPAWKRGPTVFGEDAASQDAMWRAMINRDTSSDGRFVYGVTTTGVYCRPSCPSRRPLRRNVRYFRGPVDAEAAGLRPCKRCRPSGAPLQSDRLERVAQACRLIEEAEEPPSLHELAHAIGLSPYHFHRIFKQATGLTPKGYARARREERLRTVVPRARSVTEAIYDAGYNSSARFYEGARGVLGMTPTTRRAAGAGETIRFALGTCSLGVILVAATEHGVCHIALGEDPEDLLGAFQHEFANAELVGGDPSFEAMVARVVELVEMPANGCDLPLDVRGTAFQQRVWTALRKIPPGTTATYAEVAAAIGAPRAVRAVARACAANRCAVAIPCHRVVRSDGGISGYRWGVERKRALLLREKID